MMLESIWQDIRYGLGQIVRRPRLSILIILVLALGIGPNATIFTLLHSVLGAELDIERVDRMVLVGQAADGDDSESLGPVSTPDFEFLLRESRELRGLFANSGSQVAIRLRSGSEMALTQIVSSNYFDVLGRSAFLGEVFHRLEDDLPGRKAEIVLSHRFWAARFEGDHQVVGDVLAINGRDFRIVGVMPETFTGNMAGLTPDFWSPLAMIDSLRPSETGRLTNRSENWLQLAGRMRAEASLESLNRELEALSRAQQEAFPETNSQIVFEAREFSVVGPIPPKVLAGIVSAILFLVLLILLVACSSVAALLLARSTERRQEVAVRLALGASRLRVIRQLLVESSLLSMLAGILALLMTLWTGRLVLALLPEMPIPITIDLQVDGQVLLYCAFLCLLATFVFGLAPALQVTRSDLMSSLKDQPVGGSFERRTSRLRSVFLLAQFSLSVTLLTSAVLAVSSLRGASEIDAGFEREHLLVFRTDLGMYGYLGAEKDELGARLRDALLAVDGIDRVGLVRTAPFAFDRSSATASRFGHDLQSGESHRISYTTIGVDYFGSLGVELLAGRVFEDRDRDYVQPVVIANEAAAGLFFPGREALGGYISLPHSEDAFEVVGIAETVKNGSLGEHETPFLYLPMRRDYSHNLSFLMRTADEPEALVDGVRSAIASVDSHIAVDSVSTMEELVEVVLIPAKLTAALCSALGLLAIILTVIGVYGVVSYSIRQRQQEVGVRLTLGASPTRIVSMLLSHGMALVGVGALVGLGLSLVVARVLSFVLTDANQPLVFLLVPLLLLALTALSLFLPARRASQMQPMAVLRYE